MTSALDLHETSPLVKDTNDEEEVDDLSDDEEEISAWEYVKQSAKDLARSFVDCNFVISFFHLNRLLLRARLSFIR